MSDDEDKAVRTLGRGMCLNSEPSGSFNVGTYAGTDKDDEAVKGKGVYATAGVGRIRAEDGSMGAEAKGPNVGIGAGFSLESGARAMAKAELASVSLSAWNVTATVGLSADTGVGIGPSGIEAKFLGTGFTIGREMGFSLFGSGITVKLW